MQVDRARNCFLDLHGKFSLSLSEILKKVVWPHPPPAAQARAVTKKHKKTPQARKSCGVLPCGNAGDAGQGWRANRRGAARNSAAATTMVKTLCGMQ